MNDANHGDEVPDQIKGKTRKSRVSGSSSELQKTIKTEAGSILEPENAPGPDPRSSSPVDPLGDTAWLKPEGSLSGGLNALREGVIVADRYEIKSVLGVGGMGIVYRALDQTLGIEIALKVLRPEVAHDEEFLERFRNELLIARQVTHRNVVRLHDIGEHDGLYYLSMDLVVGHSLRDVLKGERKMEPAEAVRILTEITRALAEAHRQGVVHRDLKPANILLDEDTGEAYISDFGIARSVSISGMTATGVVVGTPQYLSPEQARGETVGVASDVYALGIIFAEMLSGKLPFSGGTLLEILSQRIIGHAKSLEELGVEVDPALGAVVDRCLAREVDARYPSASELLEDLEDLSRPAERKSQEKRRRLALQIGRVAAVCAAIALVVVAAIRFLPSQGRQGSPTSLTPAVGESKTRYSVAILPFSIEGSDELAWASSGVAEMLSSALTESEDLRVVESLRVAQTLQDLGFTPGQIREDQLGQLAEVFEANRLIMGTLRVAGDSIRLETRLVEVDRPGSPTRQLEALQGEAGAIFDLAAESGSALRQLLEVEEGERAAVPLTDSPVAMEAYARGLDLLARGETLQAAPELKRAVTEDPSFAAAWVRLAKAYEALGRGDDALEAARESVRAAGTGSGRLGYEARAREALLRGEHETAQKFLEELVERYPNDTEAQIALAEAYGQVGRYSDAVAQLQNAAAIDGSQPRTWYLLGRYSIQGGDAQKAIDEYLVKALIQHKTFKNEQGQAEVHNALGVAYQNLGQLENAAESLGTAAEIRKRIGDQRGLATSLLNLSLIDITRGQSEAAELHLLEALAIHEELGNRPGIAETYNALGVLEERRGHYREALDHYFQALNISKDLGDHWMLAESHSNVGYSHYLLGEYNSALLYLGEALRLYRENEEPRGTLVTLQSIGFCQEAQGQWTAASRSFLEALNLAREIEAPIERAVSHGNLGVLAQHEGRYRAAFESYGEALRLLEEVGDVLGKTEFLLRQAEAYLDLGSTELAANRLDQVEAIQSEQSNREDLAKRLRLRGRWYQQRGELDEAKRLFDESLVEAKASRGAKAALEVQMDRGLFQLSATRDSLTQLRTTAEESERLGHALLILQSAEALGRAELQWGAPEQAEAVLRGALRQAQSREANGYAGSYRLWNLLAMALDRLGQKDEADKARRDAAADLEKVREEIPEELRAAFDALPEVAEILSGPNSTD